MLLRLTAPLLGVLEAGLERLPGRERLTVSSRARHGPSSRHRLWELNGDSGQARSEGLVDPRSVGANPQGDKLPTGASDRSESSSGPRDTPSGFGGDDGEPTTVADTTATATLDPVDAANLPDVETAGQAGDRSLGNAIRRLRGVDRVAAIAATLTTTQMVTMLLGFVYWTYVARRFPVASVGLAGAAIAAMQLLGSFGMLGFGTLLIDRLPRVGRNHRRLMVRTSLSIVAAASGILGLAFAVAIRVIPIPNLLPVSATWLDFVIFVVGVLATGITLVLDQAVLALGNGTVQLERNGVASVTKIAAIVALVRFGAHGGMAIYLSWTIGVLVSLMWVFVRTHAGWSEQASRRLVDLRSVRGLGRAAASHHALNLAIQTPLMLLPPIVAVTVSSVANGYFSTDILLAGVVFAIPFAIAVGLFAAAAGDEREMLKRIRFTIPFGIACSLAADVVVYVLGRPLLAAFGRSYAEHGVGALRILVLAGVPFVIKDHYIALRRVQSRTSRAAVAISVTTIIELAIAFLAAERWGVIGMCLAWVGTLAIEAIVFAFPLSRAHRVLRRQIVDGALPNEIDRVPPTSLQLEASDLDLYLMTPALMEPMVIDDTQAALTELPSAGTDSESEPSFASAPQFESVIIEDVPGFGADRFTESSLSLGHSPLFDPQMIDEPIMPPGRWEGPVTIPETAPRRSLAGPTFFAVCVGLFLMSMAAVAGRADTTPWVVDLLFWAGLVTMFIPPAVMILLPRTSRPVRIGCTLLVGVAFQLSRFALFPLQFVFHDELIHEAALNQIETSHRLFQTNSLLPVTSSYPGLELATYGVHDVLGLPNRAAALVVLLLARSILALAILLGIERITGSLRIATLASLLYICNEQYLFFNSQFSYQTLALPLAIFTVYLLLRNEHQPGDGPFRRSAVLLPMAAFAATAVTHHLTSMLLALCLCLWLLVEHRTRPGSQLERSLRWCVPFSVLTVVVVAARPGNSVLSYLHNIAYTSWAAVWALLTGKQTHRLFTDSSGYKSPAWEVYVTLGSELAAVIGLAFALVWVYRHRTWRRYGSLAALFVAMAVFYPLVPAGHLTTATSEVTDRASGFLFLGVAFVFAVYIAAHRRWLHGPRLAVTTACLVLVFVGQIILGTGPPWGETPGPYLVSADQRSIDRYNIAAAEWSADHLATGSTVLADRDAGLLAGALGHLHPITHVATGVDASAILLAPTWTPQDAALLRKLHIEYVIVDERDSDGLPRMGVYYEGGEYDINRTTPVSRAALVKLASLPGIQRIYDNGAIVIYDVRSLDGPR